MADADDIRDAAATNAASGIASSSSDGQQVTAADPEKQLRVADKGCRQCRRRCPYFGLHETIEAWRLRLMGIFSRIAGMFGGRNKATRQTAAARLLARRFTPRSKRATMPLRTSDEYGNIWANADRFDADSAHSPLVRHAHCSLAL